MKFLILVLLLSACAPLLVSNVPDCPDCSASPDTEYNATEYRDAEAYYRGVYTLCMVFNAKAAENGASRFFDCAEMVRNAYRLKWHERDAPGFEWPVEEESELNNTAMNYVK